MERRFAARRDQLLADAEVDPRIPRGVLLRLERFLDLFVEQLAAAKGCTPGQLALAWVLAQGKDIVPIPGTKRVKYLDENLAAVNVRLAAEELAQLDAILPPGAASGERYNEQAMRTIDR